MTVDGRSKTDAETPTGLHITHALKLLLAVMPVSFVVDYLHVRNQVLIGLSFIVGTLLQATIPPQKMGLFPLLTVSVLYTLGAAILGK